MGRLELRLLGGYAGTWDSGQPLEIPTRKAWALLAYLTLHPGRPFAREHLAALLWGERFDEQARRSLRQTLYELRGALGDELADALIATRDSVALNGEALAVDALRFEQLVTEGRAETLCEAEPLYRGAFLEGFETGEAAFDEWRAGERARFRELACHALEQLAIDQLAHNAAEAGIDTARRVLRLDPLREQAHRLVMQGLAAAGRRSEALKHYRELEDLLQAELGVGPDPATLALDEALRLDAQEDAGPLSDTAGGGGRTAEEGEGTVGRGAWRSWRGLAAAAAVVLAVAATAVWYAVSRGPDPLAEVAREAEMAFPLPDKPSIAVLPFDNLSSDPSQDFFADGLTEDLITALSKVPQLFVIARTSVAGYKGKDVTVREVAEALGVRYVLEGSVQKSNGGLRITGQLIDALSGYHLWAERYDRRPGDIFVLQDEIVRRILIELQVKLTSGDHAHVASRGTANLDAWLLRLRAVEEIYKFSRESTVRARELLQKAHELDPNWSRPVGGIAWSYWWEARRGWTDDREGWIRKGMDYAEKAIEMDPEDTLGYMQLGNLAQLQGDHERAIALREKAVALAPNDFQANWGLGGVLIAADQAERAVEVMKHAVRVSPIHPVSLDWGLAQAQLVAAHYEGAIETAKRASARAPAHELPYMQMTAAYSALGRMEEARGAAAELLRVDPKFTASSWRPSLPDYKNPATVDKLVGLLTKAGLPE